MQLPPRRSLGDAERARLLGIEATFARRLDQRVAKRRRAAVFDAEDVDGVAVPWNLLSALELRDLERKGQPLVPQAFGAAQHTSGAARAPQPQRLGATLARH